ncbi:zinc finger BED domain-containing protein 1-like [Sipha flava]|uniref:Zinc finger BED domain-containing protein 1-like n=1 Tax=Sipha flava TaxID=143950 RepID=A0A8B8FNN7_9HEMI|nr:zinc finger BED domain-containing protein 1-like [Sipha flava]
MPYYRERTSELWNHFEPVEGDKAKCDYCSMKLSTAGGSLNNLKRHLLARHPTVTINRNESNQQRGTFISLFVMLNKNNNIKLPHTEHDIQTSSTSTISFSSPNVTQTSLVMASILSSECRPLSVTKKKQLDEQLAKMIVKRYYPFALVEDPEFKKFLNMLNPSYTLPSRKTVSNNIIPRLYESSKNDVQHLIDQTIAVCLTTDCWTSKENTKFDVRHTGDNISEKLITTMRNWNITHKVTVINGLKHISSITQKVKIIVEYFKRSHHALAKLYATQEQMNLPKLKLTQDVVTRWNSTFDMLQRFVKVKDAINSTLAVLQANVDMLSSEEWIIVEKASVVLEIFYDVTNEICSDQYVTLSVVLIFTSAIFESMKMYEQDITLPIEIKEMVSTLKQQTISRLKPLEDNDLVTQAALLDPRYKKLAFSNVNVNNSINENPQQSDESTCIKSSLLCKSFDEQYNRQKASHNPQAAGIIEVDKYLNEPILNRHENPLTWWNSRKSQYPRLYNLVLKRLCIVATSIPCERLFSKAGMTLTEQRNRIKPSKASQILFLNQNL